MTFVSDQVTLRPLQPTLSTESEQQGQNIRVRPVFLTLTKFLDLLVCFHQVCKKEHYARTYACPYNVPVKRNMAKSEMGEIKKITRLAKPWTQSLYRRFSVCKTSRFAHFVRLFLVIQLIFFLLRCFQTNT